MLIGTGRKQQYINASSAAAFRRFTDELHARICNALDTGSKSVVFLCIGTDRSTGDSLGPLIGYKISGLRNRNVHVYGTLENPVHARNIDEVMKRVAADCHKTGIVNFGGFMDFLILQNTRLHVVMRMADLIASGIRFVIWKLEKSSLLPTDRSEAGTAEK